MRGLLLFFIILFALALIGYASWRRYRGQVRRQRRAAWHAKRQEEDRIWYEKMGDTVDMANAGVPRSLTAARAPGEDEPSPGR
jgi:hypothetical protein